MSNDALGTSLSIPMRPDGAGGLALARGPRAVEEVLRAIIETILGAHLLEPWLGLRDWVFRAVQDTAAIEESVKEAIRRAEPQRIDGDSLRVEVGEDALDQGSIIVVVVYTLSNEETPRTLQHGYRLLPAA